MTMAGRPLLITRTAQGIGKSIAEPALTLGARVIAADLNIPCFATTDHMFPLTCNVSQPGRVEETVAAVIERFGTIDGLVSNTGKTRPVHAIGSGILYHRADIVGERRILDRRLRLTVQACQNRITK